MSSVYRIRVAWTAWATTPPYGIMFVRWLTPSQHWRFNEKIERHGLADGFAYALKVGSKRRDGKREKEEIRKDGTDDTA